MRKKITCFTGVRVFFSIIKFGKIEKPESWDTKSLYLANLIIYFWYVFYLSTAQK